MNFIEECKQAKELCDKYTLEKVVSIQNGRKRKLNIKVYQNILNRFTSGDSTLMIAKHYKVSRNTIYQKLKYITKRVSYFKIEQKINDGEK